MGRRQGGGRGLRSRSPGLCGHSPDDPAVAPKRGVAARLGLEPRSADSVRRVPAEPPASPPCAPRESPPSSPRVPRRSPDVPRPLTVRRPAPGRTLTRPMNLRLRGLHGRVPRTRGERGSHAWRSRPTPASQPRVPPKTPPRS